FQDHIKDCDLSSAFSSAKTFTSELTAQLHPCPLQITMCTQLSSSVFICCQSGQQSSIPTSRAPSSTVSMLISRTVSEPQCCHCGWRGAHAPGCPFK
ncbi:uncharacterized protein EV420DRAFT_1559264, partial [Desarmillaria tabescens]